MSAYESSSSNKRFASLNTTDRGVNSLIKANHQSILRTARAVSRSNPHAISATNSVVTDAIGTGIRPQSAHPDLEIRRRMQGIFKIWENQSDPEGQLSFYGQQMVAFNAMFEGGECFARFRPRQPGDGLKVPVQIQLLEPEHLDISKERAANGNRIVNGIEYNRIGQRVNYHLFREHPGELVLGVNNFQSVSVPAKDMLHVFRPSRPGQGRGLTWLNGILLKLFEIDKYDDGEVMRKQLSSFLVGYITDAEGDVDSNVKDNGDGSGELAPTLEPATISHLPPGKDIKFNQPTADAQYAEFWRSQMSTVATTANTLYHKLTGDLRGINFSSVRAGIIDLQRKTQMIQHNVFVFQFCRPTWIRVMDTAVFSGAVDLPGYMEDPTPFHQVTWIPQGQDWVDPVKAAAANKLQIEMKIKSRSECIRERGRDPEEVFDEIAAEEKMMKDKGIENLQTGIDEVTTGLILKEEDENENTDELPQKENERKVA